MLDALRKDIQEKMAKSVESVGRDFASVRAGKATPSLLDSVKVEAYETVVPLNQVATVTAPEARLLIVQAFDKGTVGNIAKAIQKADLGLNPSVEGQIIRLPVPPLNEERRKELVKYCRDIAEKGRIAIRNVRRDGNDTIKQALKDKEISEDEQIKVKDDIQKFTDEFIAKVDSIFDAKEADVMEI